jgi:hypothetical protein
LICSDFTNSSSLFLFESGAAVRVLFLLLLFSREEEQDDDDEDEIMKLEHFSSYC